jgi:hypothetical protein
MRKTIAFALVCAGLAVNLPAMAESVTQPVAGNISQSSTDLIAQYPRNNRRFNVYYRYRSNRPWRLENSYASRFNAERAASNLERRGYQAYIQLTREVNRRYG